MECLPSSYTQKFGSNPQHNITSVIPAFKRCREKRSKPRMSSEFETNLGYRKPRHKIYENSKQDNK